MISAFDVYTFQLSLVSSFPWLHCDSISALPKQAWGPPFHEHTKIVTENFRWGLKWERITPNFPNHEKAMTGWYDFSNIKSFKMLSFKSAAEAHCLIYPVPSGGNFSFTLLRNHMKHSFHVFHHGLKTFERDKHLSVAAMFISFSCFHTMMKRWNPCFLYYYSTMKAAVFLFIIPNIDHKYSAIANFQETSIYVKSIEGLHLTSSAAMLVYR